MTWFRTALLLSLIQLAAACSYGREHTVLDLQDFIAKPHSHEFAVTLEYARVKNPTGFLNTFPNGGIRKVIYREARVYRGDLDLGTVELVAAIPDFAGIPQPKSAQIEGWQNDAIHFSLFGYGGNAWDGDDLSDKRRFFYRVTAAGDAQQVGALPAVLERVNDRPVKTPPFLHWSRGHLDVAIAIDSRTRDASRLTRLTFEPETGEPRLSMVEQ